MLEHFVKGLQLEVEVKIAYGSELSLLFLLGDGLGLWQSSSLITRGLRVSDRGEAVDDWSSVSK